MSEPTLTLSSERFHPSGGFAAEGVKKLLGAPNLSLMHTVLRETVQNTWDARNGREPIKYLVRLRRLTRGQVKFLAENVFRKTPPHLDAHPIRTFLSSDSPIVMEIADWGTRGLCGPTRADTPSQADQPSNFVDFIRNVGMRHHGPAGAGTYGYGKSSLYLASQCSTIVVDTLAELGRSSERRFISAHLGEAFEHRLARYTGRHWWGLPSRSADFVEPVIGADARVFSDKLGMPSRSGRETGTTIMMLAPHLPSDKPIEILGAILEAILWNFWPKMLDDNGPLSRINFELEAEGQRASFPSPESFPPLDLFVEAYRALRKDETSATTVECLRPKKVLGKMSFSTGFRNERQRYVSPESSIIPHTSSHIAVMRPVELVVRYFEGAPVPNSLQEWAGVFICDEDQTVERAFAAAEPPAHDDWVPEMLQKGHQKTFVNVALRRIKEAAANFAGPSGHIVNLDGGQPSLARAADRLGRLLETEEGSGTAPNSKRARGREKSSVSIGTAEFMRLRETGLGVEAEFAVRIRNQSATEVEVTAVAGIVIDGALSTEQAGPSGQLVRVRGWDSSAGKSLSLGASLTIPRKSDETYWVRATVPPLSAVSVVVEVSRHGRQ